VLNPEVSAVDADGPVQLRCLSRIRSGQQSEYLYELSRAEAKLQVRVVRRRRKSLAVYVEKGVMSELRAPLNCAWDDIHGFLAGRFDWIREAEVEVSTRRSMPVDEYHAGGMISFLGQRYRLDLATSRFSVTQIEDDQLYLSCADPSRPDLVKKKLHEWFRRESELLFESLLRRQSGLFTDGVVPSGLVIRKMKSRWGSCSSSGEICLNLLLIREALPQIEFVITHELCHLRHFAHNRPFYGMMDELMPDWRDRESRLGHGAL
jgi:predicted metal-dependent hydrolase